jgi:hypothetical protein|tara:strand:- start:1472 stop:1807 length:336 start_codon:yes stop_codon:yes gene_type:complete
VNKKTRMHVEAAVLAEIEGMMGSRMAPVARHLAGAGIANQPEGVRTELMKLVAGLDPQNREELEELAAMVAKLMDASRENIQGKYGLEESLIKKVIREEIKAVLNLRSTSK